MQANIERLFRLKDLVDHLKMSRSSIWAGVKDGTFPRPIRLSKRTVAWSENQIEAWLSNRKQLGEKA